MKAHDPYELWKTGRSSPPVAPSFAEQVMDQVRLLQPPAAARPPLLRHQVGLAAAMLIAGASLILARFVCTIGALLAVAQKGF